jgi:hypothetical protein
LLGVFHLPSDNHGGNTAMGISSCQS